MHTDNPGFLGRVILFCPWFTSNIIDYDLIKSLLLSLMTVKILAYQNYLYSHL